MTCKINVVSYIPYINNVKSEYSYESEPTILQLLMEIQIKWDEDALIVINKVICTDRNQKLHDQDLVELLIPLSGG